MSECRTSTCDGNLTSGHDAFVMVSLHATEADADEALRSVNSTDCGGCCRGRRHHYIEALDCAGCLDHDDRALTLEDL